jgi:hypothetical protein
MSRAVTWLAGAVALLSAIPCAAHPGHGTTAPDSIEHYVAEPLHGWPLAVMAAVALAAVWAVR